MQESVYYKATDEDGNTVLKHGWKKHKYLYIKNGKYIYPEDVYKTVKNGVRKTAANIDQKVSSMYRKNIYPHTEAGKIDAMNRKANARQKVIAKQHKQLAVKDSRVKSGGSPVDTSAVRRAKAQRMLAAKKTVKAKTSVPYKGPTSAISAQNAQKERDLQKRIRAVNAHTVAKKNSDMVKKKQQRQMKQIKANVKKQNAPSTKVKKAVKFATKVATRDSAAKMAATRYLVSKAAKSPTANAAKAKARSVVSKGEYKLERAGQKLARDVKKTGVYKATKKATRRATSAARKAKTNAQDRALTSAEVRNKANSVKSKAEYKISRAGQKLANDAKPYTSSAKKQFDRASKNAGKAYNSAKKEFNRVSKNANKAYKTAKKRVKKVRRSFNKAKRAGKAYLDYLTK